jgi:hypothetical protein
MNVMSFDQLLQAAGMGITGDQYVEEYFSKALGTNNSGPGGHQSGPLMLENLDALMTEVLITEQHFKLFNAMPKVPSSQPYFEYNRHKGFGSNRAGGAGFRQGGAPNGGVSPFERKGIYNKYLGVKGGVTHQMITAGQNGGAFEDPVVRENRDRTLELLERVEREMIFGNKSIKDGNGEEVNFDGLLAQLAADYSANVVDMKGAPLGFDQIDDSARKLVTTGKQPTVTGYKVMGSTHVVDGLNMQFAARNLQRFNKDTASGQQYTPGTVLSKYDTQFGTFEFDHSILFDEVEGGAPALVAPSGAPTAPGYVATTGQPTAADDAAGQHIAGTYYYTIAAFNDVGESLGTISNAVVVPDATTKVTIGIVRVANATGYRIYRGKLANGSDAKWIAKIPQSASGDLSFVDKGEWYTVDANGADGNGLAIIYKPDPRDLVVAQMSPLMKLPLPIEGTTFPFLLLLYMVPVLKSPERLRIYKNCGTYKAS